MPSKKKLKRKLKQARRETKYAERDAKMWIDIVIKQEDALDTKDVLIADLEVKYARLKERLKELEKPNVSIWHNGETVGFEVE
jgi:hypothetical protein